MRIINIFCPFLLKCYTIELMANKVVKQIPNFVTLIRLGCAVALIFLAPLSIPFIICYVAGGFSDALDGFLARKLKAESKLGNILDSISDLTFYIVLTVKMFPILLAHFNIINWIIIIVPTCFHLTAYILCAIKFHKLSALHTYANKLLSFLIFVFPFTFIGDIWLLYNLYMYIGGVFALYGSIEIVLIHIIAKTYDTRNKSIFLVKRNEKTPNEN